MISKTTVSSPTYKDYDVLAFWFDTSSPKDWFTKDDAFDAVLREQFGSRHEALFDGSDTTWKDSPEGALAAIIVLDQFSRNMFRESAQSFQYDDSALRIARYAIEQGFDLELKGDMRAFMYMPFMHSESKQVHEEALQLFNNLGMQGYLDFELKHKIIIDRFGRYPHRNEVLGRESTQEEIAFLVEPNSSF